VYYSSYVSPYHDETLIPILCTSQHYQTSPPVKMRILVKSPSSSVPTTRRFYSGADHRYIRHPYHHILPPPPPSTTPLYYPSPLKQQQHHLFVNPYRSISPYSGGNKWSTVLRSSHHHPYRRFRVDNRLLSERLWDIDSEDDQDEIEETIPNIHGGITPTRERLKDFRSSQIEHNDHNI
jgi:hypothetical protein